MANAIMQFLMNQRTGTAQPPASSPGLAGALQGAAPALQRADNAAPQGMTPLSGGNGPDWGTPAPPQYGSSVSWAGPDGQIINQPGPTTNTPPQSAGGGGVSAGAAAPVGSGMTAGSAAPVGPGMGALPALGAGGTSSSGQISDGGMSGSVPAAGAGAGGVLGGSGASATGTINPDVMNQMIRAFKFQGLSDEDATAIAKRFA